MSVISLTEQQVKDLLDWPLVCGAVEEALRSICEFRVNEHQPAAVQPARVFTQTEKGILLCMPGYISNYKLSTGDQSNVFNSLGCKLVTSFKDNEKLSPPKPSIMGNIFLFSSQTGELTAIIAGSEITAWRTAAASLVATKYLHTNRPSSLQINTLAIVGCGVQGRIHSIGFCATNFVKSIYLWNRTKCRAEALANELNQLRASFKNPEISIVCTDSVEECAKKADVIVTATYTSTPLLFRSMVKDNVHINAVGAGQHHHSEISEDIYTDSCTKIYVDSNGSAKTELKTLNAPIVGEIGDIINGRCLAPSDGITIFHSMGMAVEDVAVGQAVLEKFKSSNLDHQ